MISRAKLIAIARTAIGDGNEIERYLNEYTRLEHEIVHYSNQLTHLAEDARASVTEKNATPSIDNSFLISTTHKLACKLTAAAELLSDIRNALSRLGWKVE